MYETLQTIEQPIVNERKWNPVVLWAVVGMTFFLFEIYVLGRWITGPYFAPTDPGPDTITEGERLYYIFLQVIVTGAFLVCMWLWVIKPWRREGRLTSDAMLALSASMIFFWDMCMNYTSTTLLYNSNFVNFGAWSLGSWPGWMSPNGNLLPEPIFVCIPGYTCLVFSQAVLICWLLRKAKARWTDLGIASVIGLIILGLTIIDGLIEICLLRMNLYAYPGAISAVTLFAGKTYQLPLTEAFLFGGLGIGSMAALRFFKDDKGRTFVERGSEQLKIGQTGKLWVRFLAIFGFIHFMFFALYMVPNQWIALHHDAFPEGYPSYLTNNMCVYGPDGDECPGPGVWMKRPENVPF